MHDSIVPTSELTATISKLQCAMLHDNRAMPSTRGILGDQQSYLTPRAILSDPDISTRAKDHLPGGKQLERCHADRPSARFTWSHQLVTIHNDVKNVRKTLQLDSNLLATMTDTPTLRTLSSATGRV